MYVIVCYINFCSHLTDRDSQMHTYIHTQMVLHWMKYLVLIDDNVECVFLDLESLLCTV